MIPTIEGRKKIAVGRKNIINVLHRRAADQLKPHWKPVTSKLISLLNSTKSFGTVSIIDLMSVMSSFNESSSGRLKSMAPLMKSCLCFSEFSLKNVASKFDFNSNGRSI